MKKILVITAVVMALSYNVSAHAGPAAGVLTAAAKVAGEILGKSDTETETTISNSDFKNKVEVTDSNVLGNVGVELKGDKLKVSNSTFKNNVKIKDSNVMGNSGIKVGK